MNNDFQRLEGVYFEICLYQGHFQGNKQRRQFQSKYSFHFDNRNENLKREILCTGITFKTEKCLTVISGG